MLPVPKWEEIWTQVDYQALRARLILAALEIKTPRIKDTGVFVNVVVKVPKVRACADIASSGNHCPIREHEILEGLEIYRGAGCRHPQDLPHEAVDLVHLVNG